MDTPVWAQSALWAMAIFWPNAILIRWIFGQEALAKVGADVWARLSGALAGAVHKHQFPKGDRQ